MTSSYRDPEETGKIVGKLLTDLARIKKEDKAILKALPKKCADEIMYISDTEDFTAEKDRITEKYRAAEATLKENVSTIEKLLSILITELLENKLQKFEEALKKLEEGPFKQRIMGLAKPEASATSQVASSSMPNGPELKTDRAISPTPLFQAPKLQAPATPAEVARNQLYEETRKYLVYLEVNKIEPLKADYNRKYNAAKQKNKSPDEESKEMKKLTTNFQKKLEKYNKEKKRIGDLRKALRGKDGEPAETKLANFQTAFNHWKEHDMKWRMYRSRESRGKGLFSLNVKKIFTGYDKKIRPPAPPSRFNFSWRKKS